MAGICLSLTIKAILTWGPYLTRAKKLTAYFQAVIVPIVGVILIN